jgi:glycosyltransferase involved in cell wall biosynthesis
VGKLKSAYPQFDFIVVNDGSSDATADLCRENGFSLLDLSVNLGLSGAVVAGMKYAYLHGYDAVVQFDADGQHRPEYLQPLLDALKEGSDIVCGSRYLTQPKPTSARMLGGSLIAWAIRLTTGVKLSDPTSGFRAYNKRIIQKFATQINMTPEPDTLSYLMKIGAKVDEIQVSMDERQAGQSYLTFSASIKYMLRMGISILLVQLFRQGSLKE